MDCQTARRLIDAYMDSELDSQNAMEIESHIAGCETCLRALESRQELSKAIKAAATYLPVPAGLRIQIEKKTHVKPGFRFGPVTTGLAFAVGVVVVLAVWHPWSSRQDQMVVDVLAQHEESVSKQHPVDLASTDPKKIQSWFADKVGFIPRTPVLNAQGFDLVGGRLGLVDGRSVPVLVYNHSGRKIDIFITYSSDNAPKDADSDGNHVRSWNDCGIDYWSVSDDSPSNLLTLRREFLKQKQ